MKGSLNFLGTGALGFVLAAGLLLGGCAAGPSRLGTAVSTPPLPTALTPAATWTPLPPDLTGFEVQLPTSDRAVRGVAYPLELFTHCGPDYIVDFDGSFWQVIEPAEVPRTLGNPSQEGTLTLLTADLARFDSVEGYFHLMRHTGPKFLFGCE